MNKPHAVTVQSNASPLLLVAEDPPVYDAHAYLRPWRYFRFYMLHEPKSNRTCWLPEGYDV